MISTFRHCVKPTKGAKHDAEIFALFQGVFSKIVNCLILSVLVNCFTLKNQLTTK